MFRLVIFAALTAAVNLGAAVAATSLPPVEAYAALPSLDSPQLSPSGDKLAYIRSAADGRELVVVDRKTRSLVTGSKLHDAKVRSLIWADDDHVILTYSTAKDAILVEGPRQERGLATLFNIKTRRPQGLLQDSDEGEIEHMNTVVAEPMPRQVEGATAIFVAGICFPPLVSLMENKQEGVVCLYKLDADGRHARLVLMGQPTTIQWWVSSNGENLLRLDHYPTSGRSQLFISIKGKGFQKISDDTHLFGPLAVLGLSSDGAGALIERSGADAGDAVVRVDAGGESVVRAGSFAEYFGDSTSGGVIGGVVAGFSGRIQFFDAQDEARWRLVAKAMEPMVASPVSWSRDRKIYVVSLDGAPAGAAYAVIDLNSGAADILGDRFRGVGPEQIGQTRVIAYKAADGLEIPALLTYPVGVDPDRAPKGLALIVLPHGGPAASDSPQFDWMSQSLASQGWAVLQPQFRGSTGFGEALYRAGFGQWGRKMQSDLLDGVRFLAKEGRIDPQRVAILGASYGGYAALAAAAFDGQAYRCAVSIAGISDVKRMRAWEADRSGSRKDSSQRFWDRFMGGNDLNDPVLDQISPAKHAGDVSIPVMLIHGKDDTVVDVEQSRIMEGALRAAGKPVEFVSLAGEDHWLSRPETRAKTMIEAAKFLRRCNPPD